MPLPPAIPVGGIAGLRFLDRTYDRQFETFNRSPDLARTVEYFQETAESITTLDQLMGDRRILGVVLGAFGLDEDLNKGAFIRKVIEEGTLDSDAFANRLVDPAYREMSEALGFGNFDGGSTLLLDNVRDNILERFQERQFELAVGNVDLDMRLALNFRREAAKVVDTTSQERTTWLRMLGSTPLRQVLEGALNLPSQFASVDLDQQVDEIIDRADRFLDVSSPKDLLDPNTMKQVVDRFMANRQISQGSTLGNGSGSTALSILQSSGLGSLGSANLFASSF